MYTCTCILSDVLLRVRVCVCVCCFVWCMSVPLLYIDDIIHL